MQTWLVAACALAAGTDPGGLERVEELVLARRVVLARLADLDGDGASELVVFDVQGGMTRHRAQGGKWLVAAGEAQLEDPAHALLDFAALEPGSAATGL